jgi:hypothetical protein
VLCHNRIRKITNIDILPLMDIACPLMVKEKIQFLRSIDPHGLEQDINHFIEKETRSVIGIFFINTATGHGNETYYDAYVRYIPKPRSGTSSKEERFTLEDSHNEI